MLGTLEKRTLFYFVLGVIIFFSIIAIAVALTSNVLDITVSTQSPAPPLGGGTPSGP